MKIAHWYSRHLKIWIFVVLAVCAACSGPAPLPVVSPQPAVTLAVTPSLPPPQVQTSTAPAETATLPAPPPPTETLEPSPTSTPDPYAAYTLEHLAGRDYGGGELRVVETLAVNSYFTRTLIAYPSDGLTIYGFMNLPRRGLDGQPLSPGQAAAQPVVIALHGYIEPAIYATLDYTTRYADALARAGFVVLHPNLRGYRPSDDGDNLFRVWMAVDVLNLIALVRAQGGQPGPLALANPAALGIWGHSMGGGISTRVITVSPDVRAAVLYGAMSGDDLQNYRRIFEYFSNGTRGIEELSAPEEVFLRISPIYALDRIQAAVSIHHGEEDPDVPPAWSRDLCQRLEDLGKTVECFEYKDQPHTFHDAGDELFIQRSIEFFNRWLAGN